MKYYANIYLGYQQCLDCDLTDTNLSRIIKRIKTIAYCYSPDSVCRWFVKDSNFDKVASGSTFCISKRYFKFLFL